MSEPLCTGTVKPPADMMEAARLSLSETGFANLMVRTGGKIPTPAELCEFADAERAAQEAAASIVTGLVETTVGQVAALFSGEMQGGRVNIAAERVGESTHELFVPNS